MSHGDRPALPPGISFCPPPRDLTDVYLRRKIVGEALPDDTDRFFHAADVYSAEPEKLVYRFDEAPGTGKDNDQREWYFFAPVRYAGGRKTNARGGPGRKSRTIDGEVGKHWHSELGARPVKGGSAFGGYEQTFSYMVKNASTGKDERAGWIMTEYGISPKYGGGDLVLCEIHRSSRSSATWAAVPVSDHIVSSKKRKAADGDHLEDPTASARPRRTDDHDEQSDLVDFIEQNRRIGDEVIFDENPMAECKMKFPLSFDPVAQESECNLQSTDQAAPPSNFMENMEHDFCSSYQNGGASFADHQPTDQAAQQPSNFFQNMGQDIWSLDQICGLVAPPCAAQLENEAAGLVQTITGNDNDQMDASLREEEPELAADEATYGLPCPAFSPEMIRRCSDGVMPWPSSPTSMTMAMLWGL